MCPAPAKRPRTTVQIEASRRNGAKSGGPKTTAGKAISCRNRANTGAKDQVPAADDTCFAEILQDFRIHYQPADDHEQALVEQIALSRWRSLVLIARETAMLNGEIERLPDDGLSPNRRIARAYRNLNNGNREFRSLYVAMRRADDLFLQRPA